MSAQTDAQKLSGKDGKLIKTMYKLYESKQYKKALKTSESILKKYPKHGETHCLKALVQQQNVLKMRHAPKDAEFVSEIEQEKLKAEAVAEGKLGVSFNPKSAICWHLYGLVLKESANFSLHKEAVKAFTRAYQLDETKKQYLNDLSTVQIQVRDYDGYAKTRHLMLENASHVSAHWAGFSLSHYLLKNYKLAHAIVDSWRVTLPASEVPGLDENEIILFKARMYLEEGQIDECHSYLTSNMSRVRDTKAALELMGQISLRKKLWDDASETFLSLIDINPECEEYHIGFICAKLELSVSMESTTGVVFDSKKQALSCNYFYIRTASGIDGEKLKDLVQWYQEKSKAFPMVWQYQTTLLSLLSGSEYEACVSDFIKQKLVKNLPSLFSFFKSIYETALFTISEEVLASSDVDVPSKEEVEEAKTRMTFIGDLVKSIVESLESSKKFPGEDSKQTPDVLLWARVFYSQHLNKVSDLAEAHKVVDSAIEHTPTLIELYEIKSRILESEGKLIEAACVLDDGRKLDLADRFINTKTCIAMMRVEHLAGNTDVKQGLQDRLTAEEIAALFTKHEGDERTNMFDMQVMWYASGLLKVYAGKWREEVLKPEKNIVLIQKYMSLAFKYAREIRFHFDTFIDDQLDFHGYCLRKPGSLNVYIDFLRGIDEIKERKHYLLAMNEILDIIYASESFKNEFKKADELNKEILKETSKSSSKDKNVTGKKKRRQLKADDDPMGYAWFELELQGGKVKETVESLQEMGKTDFDTCLHLFRYFLNKKKFLKALRFIKRMLSFSQQSLGEIAVHPSILSSLFELKHSVEKQENLDDVIKTLVSKECQDIIKKTGVNDVNELRSTVQRMAVDEKTEIQFEASFLRLDVVSGTLSTQDAKQAIRQKVFDLPAKAWSVKQDATSVEYELCFF